MHALELVGLGELMRHSAGRPELWIGLIDGPVDVNHAHIARENIRELPQSVDGLCTQPDGAACLHGTFVAGILLAKRDSAAPAICPNCTLVVRPIFIELNTRGQMPTASAPELAAAIVDCIDAGARVINVSAAL